MNLYKPNLDALQAVFLEDEAAVQAFVRSISPARISRYERACEGNLRQTIDLYSLNAKLSQALYMNIQIWEVTLRNKLNAFLCWKYGAEWPYDDKRAVRSLQNNDKRRLSEAIDRQSQARKTKRVPTDAIVADLSAGFWVSLLTKSYEIPFVWRHNLTRVFPNAPGLTREEASQAAGALLDLRNRIAHHEPIYHLPLSERRQTLSAQIAATCSACHAFAEHACSFEEQWAALVAMSSPSEAPPPHSN